MDHPLDRVATVLLEELECVVEVVAARNSYSLPYLAVANFYTFDILLLVVDGYKALGRMRRSAKWQNFWNDPRRQTFWLERGQRFSSRNGFN